MSGSADDPTRPWTRDRRLGRSASPRPPSRTVRRDLAQLFCAVGGVALGMLLPTLSLGPQVDAGPVVTLLFTLGFGVISLVSIIYSMLFLVIQFSASTFTPRLGLFRDDPIVWRAFAFTVGVFVFSITSGLAIGARRTTVSTLVPGTAMVLTLIALALMRTLQTRAFHSIQLGHSLSAIATRAHRLFDDVYVRPYDPEAATVAATAAPTCHASPPPAAGATAVLWSGPAVVVQQIDVRALVGLAREHDCSITFLVAPGATVSRGMTLAEVTGGELPEAALRGALETGVERTFDQDPDLPFRLLADIALRALSPAVNDPATAVESMDRLEDLLTRLAGVELGIGHFADEGGRSRVTLPVPDWERYVRTAVDDLLFSAAGSPMALRRMRDLLSRLAERIPEGRRGIVRDRLQWVDRAGSERYPLIWAASPGG
ncbi:DUF2254 domain-containing protein [Streptomyces sp. NBC_00335]|uniref:DUF2254 family protein n=1 Tax=unclassified Streptomyces TaxID=2593676 RepID=UPI0022530ECD|nr:MULTISPECIES: DUF2254 family protein [unclassified Streptomyces]MCX5408806.1 DUF2254 domain-containing protein [Streptomyces sp. NBC_00086]